MNKDNGLNLEGKSEDMPDKLSVKVSGCKETVEGTEKLIDYCNDILSAMGPYYRSRFWGSGYF